MAIQLIFSLIAIALLYYFNRVLNCYTPATFKDEQNAIDIIKQDFPDSKTLKLNQILFLDNETALFEYDKITKGEQVFGISQAIGDSFVSRLLPLSILTNSGDTLTKNNAQQYSITIKPQQLTLPPINLSFSDSDPIYYWFLEQKLLHSSTTEAATPIGDNV